MLKGDEGVFPNVNFGFAKANVACNVGFQSHTQSFLDMGSHSSEKRVKFMDKRFQPFEFGLVFVLWNQNDYGKANKSLC